MTTYTKESLYIIITLLQYTIDGLKCTHTHITNNFKVKS